MIRCQSCGTNNLEGSRFCDECGSKLSSGNNAASAAPDLRPQAVSNPGFRGANVTSVGIPPLVDPENINEDVALSADQPTGRGSHARLVIERGDSADMEFFLSAEESNIGRWDADNGIFPDVDLDAHDPDAKVSRRHARIIRG